MGLVVTRWQKYGNDRLYVREEDARESLGYFDCKAGRLALNPLHEERTYEVIEVLRPFLGRTVPESLSELMPETPPAVESDLTRDEASQAIVAHATEWRPRGLQNLAARLLGLRSEATSWEAGAKSERIVEKQLGKLKLDGWQVLSSVMRRNGVDVDHLVIGPPGVFTINTKHHPGARVWVGEQIVDVDGEHHRYLPKSRHEANSAARILNDSVGIPIRVTPVLAFVGADSIDTDDSLGDVLIARGEEIDYVLRDLHAVYSVQERDRIYGFARRADIWLA
jgi:hypothetical protein